MRQFWDNYWAWFLIGSLALLALVTCLAAFLNETEKIENAQRWANFRDQAYLACIERQVPKDECYVRIYK